MAEQAIAEESRRRREGRSARRGCRDPRRAATNPDVARKRGALLAQLACHLQRRRVTTAGCGRAAAGTVRGGVDGSILTGVRLFVYERFLEDGRPPTVCEVAAGLALSQQEAEAAFRELEAGRVLVFEPGTLEIWMANPLCARPTAFRVATGRGSWWGTCVWDAFGIPAMLGEDASIKTSDPASGEALELRIEHGELVPVEAVAHFSVPARHWWDDIGYS
jgi:alkylmercury lyase-like protein